MYRKLFFIFLVVLSVLPNCMVGQMRPKVNHHHHHTIMPEFYRQKIHRNKTNVYKSKVSDIYFAEDGTIQNIIVYSGKSYREYGLRSSRPLPVPFHVALNKDIDICQITHDIKHNVVTEVVNGYVFLEKGVPQIIPKWGCHERITYVYDEFGIWTTMVIINVINNQRCKITRNAHY